MTPAGWPSTATRTGVGRPRLRGRLRERCRVDSALRQEPRVAEQDEATPDGCLDAVAGNRRERLDRGEAELVRPGASEDGRTERMLAPALRRAGEVEQLGDGPASQGHDLGDGRPAQRERAGLVEDDGVDAVGVLERLAAADQDAGLGALARADHDGGVASHRARAGDDDDGR
jgi:hypothetical protein